HNSAYSRVRGLMASEKLFDLSQEPEAMRVKYGPTQFGQQALVARRLIEAGVPFVKVARAWWDSHGQNFETHLELVSELDRVMSTLLDDLAERGLLEKTLVITLGEFGRTPQINPSLGRDHFASAWSASLSGCGIRGGTVYGKTDDDGVKVVDGEVGAEKPEWKELAGHESYVTGVVLAGPFVISCGWDGKLIWWNSETHELVRKIDAHAKWVRGVAATRDGHVVASVSDDMLCKLWNA